MTVSMLGLDVRHSNFNFIKPESFFVFQKKSHWSVGLSFYCFSGDKVAVGIKNYTFFMVVLVITAKEAGLKTVTKYSKFLLITLGLF